MGAMDGEGVEARDALKYPDSHNKKTIWPQIVILPCREWRQVACQCEPEGGLHEMTSLGLRARGC